MIFWEHQIMMLEIHRAETFNWGNQQCCLIHRQGIVTPLCSNHFKVLWSSTTLSYSTWHEVNNQAPVWLKDIQVMIHHGKSMYSPKAVMANHKCSPLSNLQDMGCLFQVLLQCLQHSLEPVQLFGQQFPPLLHMHKFPVPLSDEPQASKWYDSS